MKREMVSKERYDIMKRDRRKIAIDNIKLEKEIADLKKKIELLEDEIAILKAKNI